MKYLLPLLVSSLIFGCTPNNQQTSNKTNSQNGIIQGPLIEEENPLSKYIVGLYNKASGSICTGTLIEKNLVLTAAHCVTKNPSDILIVFYPDLTIDLMDIYISEMMGTPIGDLSSSVFALDVKIHEKYDDEETNLDIDLFDLALLSFTNEPLHDYKPLKIVDQDTSLNKDVELIPAGYGVSDIESHEITEEEFNQISEKLNKLQSQLAENPDAHENFTEEELDIMRWEVFSDPEINKFLKVRAEGSGELRQGEVFFDSLLNAGELVVSSNETLGVCRGDSGGPLLVKKDNEYQILGVASRGVVTCNSEVIYSDLRAQMHIDWINKNSKEIKK